MSVCVCVSADNDSWGRTPLWLHRSGMWYVHIWGLFCIVIQCIYSYDVPTPFPLACVPLCVHPRLCRRILSRLSRAGRCACIRACVGAYSRVSRVLAVVLASELMSAHSPCISRACRCDCIRACFCSYAEPPMHVSFCYSIRVRPVVIAYAVTRAWLGAN